MEKFLQTISDGTRALKAATPYYPHMLIAAYVIIAISLLSIAVASKNTAVKIFCALFMIVALIPLFTGVIVI